MTEFGRVITQNEHNLHNGNFQFIRIFINIETNDITEARYEDKWLSHLMDNFCKIIETTKDSIPDVENINEKVA